MYPNIYNDLSFEERSMFQSYNLAKRTPLSINDISNWYVEIGDPCCCGVFSCDENVFVYKGGAENPGLPVLEMKHQYNCLGNCCDCCCCGNNIIQGPINSTTLLVYKMVTPIIGYECHMEIFKER